MVLYTLLTYGCTRSVNIHLGRDTLRPTSTGAILGGLVPPYAQGHLSFRQHSLTAGVDQGVLLRLDREGMPASLARFDGNQPHKADQLPHRHTHAVVTAGGSQLPCAVALEHLIGSSVANVGDTGAEREVLRAVGRRRRRRSWQACRRELQSRAYLELLLGTIIND